MAAAVVGMGVLVTMVMEVVMVMGMGMIVGMAVAVLMGMGNAVVGMLVGVGVGMLVVMSAAGHMVVMDMHKNNLLGDFLLLYLLISILSKYIYCADNRIFYIPVY